MEATGRDQEPRSWTLRVLAPVALIATVGVLIAVITGTLSDSDSDGNETTETSTEPVRGCPENPPADAALENGYYIIKAGENLGTVTARTCVQGSKLERLNPDLDPLRLPVGACVNLRPNGCENAG
jgi:hypothetical protein